jgi:hypothetical protein
MPANKAEKQEARRQLVKRTEGAIGAIAKRLLPKGRVRGAHWEAPDPRQRGDGSRSLSVDLTTGRWRNFRSNKNGADLISLLAQVYDMPDDKAQSTIQRLFQEQ